MLDSDNLFSGPRIKMDTIWKLITKNEKEVKKRDG